MRTQRHHLDPYEKSEDRIWLCASCHNIFNKAKKRITSEDIVRDLRLRRMNLHSHIVQVKAS